MVVKTQLSYSQFLLKVNVERGTQAAGSIQQSLGFRHKFAIHNILDLMQMIAFSTNPVDSLILHPSPAAKYSSILISFLAYLPVGQLAANDIVEVMSLPWLFSDLTGCTSSRPYPS